jgi:hypothetical protein
MEEPMLQIAEVDQEEQEVFIPMELQEEITEVNMDQDLFRVPQSVDLPHPVPVKEDLVAVPVHTPTIQVEVLVAVILVALLHSTDPTTKEGAVVLLTTVQTK